MRWRDTSRPMTRPALPVGAGLKRWAPAPIQVLPRSPLITPTWRGSSFLMPDPGVEWFARPAPEGQPATFALIVGTSLYRYLPEVAGDPSPAGGETLGLAQVASPASGAYAFAKWVAASYNNPEAPLASIRLLLSPAEAERIAVPELRALGPEVLPTTRENVKRALMQWKRACDTHRENVAILYAAGHGVQLSKDDGGIVLLEDFGDPNDTVLACSMNIARVKQGMAGESMAQRQFYFVDACRIKPEALRNFDLLAEGIALDSPGSGEPRCGAMYFGAAPNTLGWGDPGRGTVFSQGLLKCLEFDAIDLDMGGRFVVSSHSLVSTLPDRVEAVALAGGRDQIATAGGLRLSKELFHVPTELPPVPLTIAVNPPAAAHCAWATLSAGAARIFERQAFTPLISTEVPIGKYVLQVSIDPVTDPYKDQWLPILSLPPRTDETVVL